MNQHQANVRLFSLDELSEESKAVARRWFRDVMCEQEMEAIANNARLIGLEITDCEVLDGYSIHGHFNNNAYVCAQTILKYHTAKQPSFHAAIEYLNKIKALVKIPSQEWIDALDQLEERFLYDLLHLYLSVIKQKMKKVYNDPSIDLTIKSNFWTFSKSGKPFSEAPGKPRSTTETQTIEEEMKPS